VSALGPLVDAHTHLDFPEFDGDRVSVLARARDAGVDTVVVCGSDPERWDLAQTLPVVLFLGVHPWVAATLDEPSLAAALDDLRGRRPFGIGEIGLDRLHAPTPAHWDRQVRALRDQLALARERDVPIQLHGVRAWPELLTVVANDGLPSAGGIAHAWSAAPDQVDRAVRLGLHLSFGALLLNDRARKARQSAARAPLDHLLVETDSPDGRPPGATRGEPAHLPLVVRALAELRGERPEVVAAATTRNFSRLRPMRGGGIHEHRT
jgi:TatD DNase family protein